MLQDLNQNARPDKLEGYFHDKTRNILKSYEFYPFEKKTNIHLDSLR